MNKRFQILPQNKMDKPNLYEYLECNKLRDSIYSILDTCRVYAHDYKFKNYLASYLNWLGRISDADFYDPQNKERVTTLKDFLELPENNIPHFDYSNCENINAYIRTKESLIQSRTNNPSFRFTTMEEIYQHSLNGLYTEIVSELEFILTRMPPNDYQNMKAANKEFYHELNKVVLKPERIEKISQRFGIEFFDYLEAIVD